MVLSDLVTERLLVQTDGNPLALVELPMALSRDQLEGEAPLPVQLHLTGTVQRGFLDRCRRLPDDVQTLLLVAAADDSARLSVVRRAAATLGVDESAINVAEQARLLVTDRDTVRVRHPLVRSAIYQAATGHERRAAHRALAEALDGGDDADRQAWHWASSVEGPDPLVVEALLGAAPAPSVAAAGTQPARPTSERRSSRQTSRHAPRCSTRQPATPGRPGRPHDPGHCSSRLARLPRTGCSGRTSTGFEAASRSTWDPPIDAHRIFVDAARSGAADDPETSP